MPILSRILCVSLACVASLLGTAAAATPGAPFTVEDLLRLKRVSDPQISPDGRLLVFVQRETDMEANRGHTSLWLLDLAEPNPQARRITAAAASDSSPRWAPDGRTLYFLSARSGTSQVWRLDLPATAPHQVSSFPLDVGALKVSPRGDRLAFSMEVFPDCDTLDCTRQRLDKPAKDKSTGRTYERLFVRHWDLWSDGTRAHLFTAPLTAGTVSQRRWTWPGASTPTSPASPSAPTRTTASARTASTWCSRRASPGAPSRGRPTSTCSRYPAMAARPR